MRLVYGSRWAEFDKASDPIAGILRLRDTRVAGDPSTLSLLRSLPGIPDDPPPGEPQTTEDRMRTKPTRQEAIRALERFGYREEAARGSA